EGKLRLPVRRAFRADVLSLRSSPGTRVPKRTVKSGHLSCGQRFRSLKKSASTIVDGSHVALLVVRQGEDTQGKDFVDLGCVKEIARTFRCHFRIIVEYNRRRQHRVRRALLTDEHRPSSLIAASGRGF